MIPTPITTFVDIEHKGSLYRLTLDNVDPSLQETIDKVKEAFIATLDAEGDLAKMAPGESTPFQMVSGGIRLKDKTLTEQKAQELSQIFLAPTGPQKEALLHFAATYQKTVAVAKNALGAAAASSEQTPTIVQELPNVGNTCFFNAAMQILADPTLTTELLKYPAAFKQSNIAEVAKQDPATWPCMTDPREQATPGAAEYRAHLQKRAVETPTLFAGGNNHPLFIVLSNYHRGIAVTSQQMRDLIERLVLEEKCSINGGGLARFTPYELLDAGEALAALRNQIDLKLLPPAFPSSGSVVTQFSTEPLGADGAKQPWIPMGPKKRELLPEIEIDPSHGLLEGLRRRIYDAHPEPTPLRSYGNAIPRAQREVFETLPGHFIIGFSQTVPALEHMSPENQREYLDTLRACLTDLPEDERRISLPELQQGAILARISNDLPLYQWVTHLINERRRTEGKGHFPIPVQKREATLDEVSLSFTAPSWLSQDNREEEVQLVAFPYHNGGASGGHYWACVRRGGQYYQVDDRVIGGDNAPLRSPNEIEISKARFLELARQARKLVYMKSSLIPK